MLVGSCGLMPSAAGQTTVINSDEVVSGGAGGTLPDPWIVTGGVYVGRDSEASLTIENGGSAQIGNFLGVGEWASQGGSNGTLIVRGVGSELIGDRYLSVGSSGDGTLVIEGGAAASFGSYVNLGHVYGHSGLVSATVDGEGSSLSTSYGINVQSNFAPSSNNGYTSHPDHITTFDITNGADVVSKDADIGTSVESFSVVTLSGAGSTWNASHGFMIGNYGIGVLNILDGAVVTSDQDANSYGSHVGTNSTGHGEVLVDGAGSKWETGKFLKVGRTGTGILTIANGGTLVTDGGNGTVFLGDESANAVGILNIGAGAGEDAAAPGTLQAGAIQFGLGAGRVVFNHTYPSYYSFDTPLIGSGTIQHIAGKTDLSGDTRDFTGTVLMQGGQLYLQNTFGDADGGDNGSKFVVTGGDLHIDLSSEASTAAIEVGAGGAFTMMGWSKLNVTGSAGITNAGAMDLADVNSAGTVTNLEGGRLNIGGVSTLDAAEIINEGRINVLSRSSKATVFGDSFDNTVINRGAGILNVGNGWLNIVGALTNSSAGDEDAGKAGIDIAAFGTLEVDETLENATGGAVINRGELTAAKIVNQAGATLTTSKRLTTRSSDGLANEGTVNASGQLYGTMRNHGSGVFNVVGDLDSDDSPNSAPFINEGSAVLNVGGGDFTGLTSFSNTSSAEIGVNLAEGRTLSVANPLSNSGAILNRGTIKGGMANEGTVINAGILKGGLVNDAGTFTNTGLVEDGVTINGGTFITHAEGQTAGITNNGALVFDQLANGAYAGLITGSGTLEKRGDGTLELTADNAAFSGATTISAGKLVINSALGGTLNLEGGTLGGNGILETLNIASGGILAPGNSVGTTNAVNFNFAPGSTYEVELNDGGNVAGVNNDFVNATGTVTINGAFVHVKPENGTDDGTTYVAGTTYTIVTAASGVTGTFVDLTDDFAFLNFALSYDSNNVYLTSQLSNMCLSNFSSNQCAVAESISGLGSGALFSAVTNLSDAEAVGAIDQLTGEAHSSFLTSLMEDSRFVRDAAIDRLRSLFDGVGARDSSSTSATGSGISLWGHVYGAFGDVSAGTDTASVDRSSGGVLTGADVALFKNVHVGLLGGYGHTHMSADELRSTEDAENWSTGIYTGAVWGTFHIRAGGAYTWSDLETRREVGFTGYSDSLSGDASASTGQVFAEGAVRIGSSWATYEPYAALAHVHLKRDHFTEDGGDAALTVAQTNMDTTFTTLGLRTETFMGAGIEAGIRLSGGLGWRHAFGDTVAAAEMAFSSGGTPFTVFGAPLAKDALVVELGADGAFSQWTRFGMYYLGQIADDADDHSVRANLAVTF